ncbi:hypothetical protein BJ170DRAFT_717738 [Xylariales sp. AK1849]|nr:hypothetical protein BJ170DRAFT_717738 [Xylariales sp. AK1849]
MAYSYEARNIFQRTLSYSAQGYQVSDVVGRYAADFQSKVDAWSSDGNKVAECKIVKAAEMLIDDLAKTSRGKLGALKDILENILGRYDCNDGWPCRLTPFQKIILAVISYIIQRCKRLKKIASRDTPLDICYADMQRSLQQAFIIQSCPIPILNRVANEFLECFRQVYEDCVKCLWNEERQGRKTVYPNDCSCGAALERHSKIIKCELRSRTAQFRARSRQFGGVTIIEIKRGRRSEASAPGAHLSQVSPLRAVEACEYKDGARGTQGATRSLLGGNGAKVCIQQ